LVGGGAYKIKLNAGQDNRRHVTTSRSAGAIKYCQEDPAKVLTEAPGPKKPTLKGP